MEFRVYNIQQEGRCLKPSISLDSKMTDGFYNKNDLIDGFFTNAQICPTFVEWCTTQNYNECKHLGGSNKMRDYSNQGNETSKKTRVEGFI